MFFKKGIAAENDKSREDIDRLMALMQEFIDGSFKSVDIDEFNNKELGKRYNALIDAAMDKNNRMLMRLNDAMNRIGDSELVKNMLEQVNSQNGAIGGMKESSHDLSQTIDAISDSAGNIQSTSHSIIDYSRKCSQKMNESLKLVDDSAQSVAAMADEMVGFKKKVEQINQIIDQVKDLAEDSSLLGLNASIEAAKAGEAGRSFAVVAEQVNQLSNNTTDCANTVVKYVGELMDEIDELVKTVGQTTGDLKNGNASVHASLDMLNGMNTQLEGINSDIDTINDEIRNQAEVTDIFFKDIESIAESYDSLSGDCLSLGQRFFRISRDIDGARGDMFRKNARPTLIDTIKVYEIDHLIFTWRIYNHIAGFEELKLEQLNRPDKCKVGVWFSKQTDPVITESEGYKQAFDFHSKLHGYAVASWEACQNNDRDMAMENFYAALEAFEGYKAGLSRLCDDLRAAGINEETPVWIYQGL